MKKERWWWLWKQNTAVKTVWYKHLLINTDIKFAQDKFQVGVSNVYADK